MNDDELIFVDNDEDILFNDKTGNHNDEIKLAPWKVLIVDDEHAVHKVTQFALSDFNFAGKNLRLDSVYSGKEAREYLSKNKDVSVVLLDVVMETSHAGLETAEWIRKELKNTDVRIILRTGQPGEAPQRKVIADYDINDYREKSELTSKQLYTIMCASLRSYRGIEALNKSREGLKKIIDASPNIFGRQSFELFVQGALELMVSLIKDCDYTAFSFGQQPTCLAARQESNEWPIIASINEHSSNEMNFTHLAELGVNPNDYLQSDKKDQLLFLDKCILALFNNDKSHRAALYIAGTLNLTELDKSLIDIFIQNLSTAYQNLILNAQVNTAQKEITYVLGEVAEKRSKETGQHVKRVSLLSSFLARKLGLDDKTVDLIEYASPLHDVGKIAIPDRILHKPEALNEEEWEIMKTHAQIGGEMFKHSDLPLFEMASQIAGSHHECWDGSGYPKGIKGDEIPVSARILALADVIDALSSKRCYKNAWDFDKIKTYIITKRAQQFDPTLVDIAIEHWSEIIDIRQSYPD